MSLPMIPSNIPFIRILDWCKDNKIRLCRMDGVSENDEVTLGNFESHFHPLPDGPEFIVVPTAGFVRLQGLIPHGDQFQRVFTLEYIDNDGWYFKNPSINLSDLHYYTACKGPNRLKRIDLNLSEEFFYDGDVQNIDDQYWVFKNINIYKDELGYFTTAPQLDDKNLKDVSLLLKCYRHQLHPREHVSHFFEVLIDVLSLTGFLYNAEIFKQAHFHLQNFANTGLAKIVNLTSPEKDITGKRVTKQYVLLPLFPDYIFHLGADTESIDIVNIKHRTTYRLFYYR